MDDVIDLKPTSIGKNSRKDITIGMKISTMLSNSQPTSKDGPHSTIYIINLAKTMVEPEFFIFFLCFFFFVRVDVQNYLVKKKC